jgi:3-hydroxymyristoyl/3-hydroxydecanoyl-(acyl carrier protein) dehydratase
MSAVPTHESTVHIAVDHPALPGHFPGAPLVPGVVLLDRVITAAEAWLGQPLSVTSLLQAKFTSPLRPGQTAQLRMQLRKAELRFTIMNAETTIAQGVLQLAQEPRI